MGRLSYDEEQRRESNSGGMLPLRKPLTCAMCAVSLLAAASAQVPPKLAPTAPVVYNDDFAHGEEFFQLNKPEEAIPRFEAVLQQEKQPNPAVYVYLGVAYYQIEDYQKSLDVCLTGLSRPDTDKKILAYNAGNSAYALTDYARADICYTTAIKTDEGFAPAYLNRANARLKQDKLEAARDDYVRFLELDSDTPQRPAIEQLLALLEEEILRREREKPELVILDDMALPRDPFNGEIIEESEAPALAVEPARNNGERIDATAPAVPTAPKANDGERIDGAAPVLASQPLPVPYGERALSRDEVKAPVVPEEQLTAPTQTPVRDDVAKEVVLPDDAAQLALPQQPPVTATNVGEIVSEPVLPAPDTRASQNRALEVIDGDDGELPPMDYWEE